MIILNQDGNIGGVFSKLTAGLANRVPIGNPPGFGASIKENNMSVNINSMDMTALSVFKRELQSIEALNRNVSPIIIEYLTQRIDEIEGKRLARRSMRRRAADALKADMRRKKSPPS